MPVQSSSDEGVYSSPDPLPRPRRRNASSKVSNASGVGGGLFSNVFSFVSRELGEFVVSATGGAEASASTSQPAAGPSRSRNIGAQVIEKRHRRTSASSQPQHEVRAPKRVRRDGEDPRMQPRGIVDPDLHGPVEQPTHRSFSRRTRSLSVTMPGSLFSRSPTPDVRTTPPDLDDRHVRFASDVVSPVPRRKHRSARVELEEEQISGEEDEDRTGDHQGDDYHTGELSSDVSSPDGPDGSIYPPLPSPPRRLTLTVSGSPPSPTTPFRSLAIRSVKDAVAMLDGDSPPQNVRTCTPGCSPKGKGKERAVEPQSVWPSMDKGKGKEPAIPRFDANTRLCSTAAVVEGAQRTPVRNRAVHGADGAGYSHDRILALDDEADKRRIRELEEKIKHLENELAQRPLPPPPPPAPPPPPLVTGSSLRSLSSRCGPGVNNVLASIRAGLKQTPNAPETSKAMPKNRLPTVPADKMEAFLSELKTVRLRKVGSGELSGNTTANTSSGISGSSSRDYSQSSGQGNSLLEDRSMMGYKRKRVDSGSETQISILKRRFILPSHSATMPASSVGPSSSRGSFLPPPDPTTTHHSRHSTAMPLMTTEVDGTTPSLCSDNGNDVDDQAPSTPPLAPALPALARSLDDGSHGAPQPASADHEHPEVRAPRERYPERRPRSLRSHKVLAEGQAKMKPAESRAPSTQSGRLLSSTIGENRAPSKQVSSRDEAPDDPFSRRPPSSPLLPTTPRRPRPPARIRSETKAASRARSRSPSAPEDSDDDPLLLSFSPPDDESTPAPDPVGKRRPAQRRRRRLTLEDEIRKVDPSYSEEERAVNELESGTLVGVGQKSKKLGFLARGGAGGDPVFMGVGYVEGAVDENQPRESNMERKGKSTRRKPKR